MGESYLLKADKTTPMEMLPVQSQVLWGPKLNAEKQARQIVKDARDKARSMMDAAKSSAKAIMNRAYKKGLEKARARKALDVAAALKTRTTAENENFPALVNLASVMAQRLVRKELEIRPEAIEAICREVLDDARGARQILLQLNPKDMALVENKREEFQLQLSAQLRMESDEKLQRGECRACGDWGEIDAGLKLQLSHLTEAILGEFSG